MEYPEKKKQYNIQYKKERMKRVPFDVKIDGEGFTYELLKMVADMKGEPVNTFIRNACIERIERILRRE